MSDRHINKKQDVRSVYDMRADVRDMCVRDVLSALGSSCPL